MKVLITVASRHQSTEEIAQAITEELRSHGLDAHFRRIQDVGDISEFDAIVLGSAVYIGNWMKEARHFAEKHRETLAAMPVWLFSSGPLGAAATDAQGRDLREVAIPKEIAEISQAITPRGHRVFFGALDPSKLGLRARMVRTLPAGRELLPEGDFRDWEDIRAWADEIAATLQAASQPHKE